MKNTVENDVNIVLDFNSVLYETLREIGII